jgi:hypothetical protein
MVDLEYRNDGLFTRFYPNTPAGENAWRQMAEQNNGTPTILSVHTDNVLYQLRKAGYSVKKAGKPTHTLEEILAELEA